MVLRCAQVVGKVCLTSRQGNRGACQKGAGCKKPRVSFVSGGRAGGQVYLFHSRFIRLKGLARDNLAEASLTLLKAQVTSLLFPQES